jgi:hypothetical protein
VFRYQRHNVLFNWHFVDDHANFCRLDITSHNDYQCHHDVPSPPPDRGMYLTPLLLLEGRWTFLQRLGRMTLLQGSAVGSVLSLILAGVGIDFSMPWLASFAVIAFVA